MAGAGVSGLETVALGFRYGEQADAALSDVSLELASGTLTWLTGAPGAGTSTLLLVAAGLAPQYTGGTISGSVRLLGEDPQSAAGRARLAGRVAYISADPASQLSGIAESVLLEVAFAPANLGWERELIMEQAEHAMRRMEVFHLASRAPASLSGGEQQRVVIASMLALLPDAWLLDEPGSALDARGRATLAATLAAEVARGATIVVASEDADWLANLAGRLVVMQRGRVVRDGAPADLLSDPALALTGAASTAVAEFARELAARDPAFATERLPVTVPEALARWA